MDIFNRKRIKELERENAQLKYKLERSESQVIKAENSLAELIVLKQNCPEDCKPGVYCEACEFAKTYYYDNIRGGKLVYGYYCGKGDSCENFIQKGMRDNK